MSMEEGSIVEPEDKKKSWKTVLFGDDDYRFLCMPRIGCTGQTGLLPFYAKDDPIPLFMATLMGLQHALAMIAGIITTPLLISTSAGFSTEIKAYLVSAALIMSAFASFIQILQIRVPCTSYAIGSGLLSVMGLTFAIVPIAQEINSILTSCSCNGVSCTVNGSCELCQQSLEGNCLSGEEAYGYVLGTILVCCWIVVLISFCPTRVIRKIFPPVVTGTCIILIGISLVGSGFKHWGGGSFCAEQVLTSKALCTGNGDVMLPFGHRNYIGLGLVVLSTLVIVETFGSPFMRNIQVIIGLAVGMLVASLSHATICEEFCFGKGFHDNSTRGTLKATISLLSNNTVCTQQCHKFRYVTGEKIVEADWITFLWVHRFPLKIYAPGILPVLFSLITSTMECIGDVTATYEASHMEAFGAKFERAIQGAILADGLNSFMAALGTVTPVTTYAQNNGVISLSRCASKRAGYACCAWLLLFGVCSKIAGAFISIPDCVLGGMTTFLFTSVVVSGVNVLTSKGMTRRTRFIAIVALGIGIGVDLVPAWVNITSQKGYPLEGNLWPIDPNWTPTFRGFRDAVIIILSNGFAIGAFIALILNLILPTEREVV